LPAVELALDLTRSVVDLTGGPVEISCRRAGRAAILELTGRCDVSADETELEPFRDVLARLIAEGCLHVAANLENLRSVDARGLGEFVFAHKLLSAAGGDLLIVAPSSRIRTMLSITRLDTVFRLCQSVDEIERVCRL
jgi:anti-sigma B factor antagonist